MEKIKIGSVVQLKSGGPEMTTSKFKWEGGEGKINQEIVECVWFKEGEFNSEYFNVNSLIIINEK